MDWTQNILGPDTSKAENEAKEKLLKAFKPNMLGSYASDVLLASPHLRVRMDAYKGKNQAQIEALEHASHDERRDIRPNPDMQELDEKWSTRFLAMAKADVVAEDAGKSVIAQVKTATEELLKAINTLKSNDIPPVFKAVESSLKAFSADASIIQHALRDDRLSPESELAFGYAAEHFRDIASLMSKMGSTSYPLSEPGRTYGSIMAGMLERMADDLDTARGMPRQSGRKVG